MEEPLSYLTRLLTPLYGAGEARAVALVALEDGLGLTRTEIYAGKGSQLSEEAGRVLSNMCERLAAGEPVQQVVGSALFCGRRFKVSRDVLTPRPETEELVSWACEKYRSGQILDAGTGSGCIAVSLALALPTAQVTACDISPAALAMAQSNAHALGAKVRFVRCDMLKNLPLPVGAEAALGGEIVFSEKEKHALRRDEHSLYNITDAAPLGYGLIVSNPPYIAPEERAEMHENVVRYEPAEALFVGGDDPLLFYRALARYAASGLLMPGGTLLVETHSQHAEAVAEVFKEAGLSETQVRKDQFGLPRMVAAKRE